MNKILIIITLFLILGLTACSSTTIVVQPTTSTALTQSTELTEANSEVQTVKMANQAYLANNGLFASDSTKLTEFINGKLDAIYGFDQNTGSITSVINGNGCTKNLHWDSNAQYWKY